MNTARECIRQVTDNRTEYPEGPDNCKERE